MFGYLRLFLAYLVLLSHLNLRLFDRNPGVFAVVIFYILAGFVVTRLWDQVLQPGPGLLGRFLFDRFLRIFPLYLCVCLLTILFLVVSGYGQPVFSLGKLLDNVLIVPLNYYMWRNCDILCQPPLCLVPPAWSLGAELQAYFFLALAFRVKLMKYLLAMASGAVYLLANYGVLNTDYFGYRLLPGVFFIFIVGHSLARMGTNPVSCFDRLYPLLIWLLAATVGWHLMEQGNHRVPYVLETMSGLLVGIPLVDQLRRYRVSLPCNKLCGALSYGIFLCHFLVIWLLDSVGFSASLHGIPGLAYIASATAGSFFLAWLGVRYVETSVDRYRLPSQLEIEKGSGIMETKKKIDFEGGDQVKNEKKD